ncbi:translation elongation factor Ts [bacterium]|nr:translation elongation factor Ts [bacterium]
MSISAKDVMALRQKTGAGMMDCKKALAETDGDLDAAIKYLREKGMASAAKRQGREANEGRVAVKISEDGKSAVIVEINSETDFVARNDEFIEMVDGYIAQAEGLADKAVDGIIPVDAFDMTAVTALAGKLGENLTLRRAGCLKTDGHIESYIHPGDMLGVLLELTGEGAGSDAAKELAHDLTLQIAAAAPQYVNRDEVPADVIEKEKEIYVTQMKNEGKPDNIIDKIATGKLNKFFEEICLIDQIYVKESKMKVADRVKEAAKAAGSDIAVSSFLRFKVGEGA